MTKVNEIIIDPNIIQRVSPISGSPNTRRKRIKIFRSRKNGIFLSGKWDLTKRTLKNFHCYGDFVNYINGEKSHYNWDKMYKSIKQKGYIQNPKKRYIEVAIGRHGDLLLVDGRHRLIIAQYLGIKTIPVNAIYVHKDYNFEKLNNIQNELLPEFLYKMITNKWNQKTKIYHKYGTIRHRYNLVKKYLPLFKDKNVLEIGCNSGMMMWSILKYANTLVELEKQEKYYNQAYIVWESLNEDKVYLYNRTFKDFIYKNYYEDIDALYASFVLYHMNDKEIELLKTQILPQCKVVIIPNRNKERRNKMNKYYLNRPEEIEKLLKECGFKVIIDISFQKGYSVIVGTRS